MGRVTGTGKFTKAVSKKLHVAEDEVEDEADSDKEKEEAKEEVVDDVKENADDAGGSDGDEEADDKDDENDERWEIEARMDEVVSASTSHQPCYLEVASFGNTLHPRFNVRCIHTQIASKTIEMLSAVFLIEGGRQDARVVLVTFQSTFAPSLPSLLLFNAKAMCVGPKALTQVAKELQKLNTGSTLSYQDLQQHFFIFVRCIAMFGNCFF